MTATVAIGRLVDEVSKVDPVREWPGGTFNYVDIAAVDQASKAIVQPQRVDSSDAPSRARQLVCAGDVLVSTVRPNLNAVALVPAQLDGAVASTGFTVLRPRAEVLDYRYLFHWVRSPAFVREMTRRATGASYPAVSDGIVKASEVPLPPVEEQRRIAARLDKTDELRAKRKTSLALTGSLTEAIFLEVVSEPAWPSSPIEALAADRKHAIRTGPFGSQLLHSEFVDGGVAVLGIDNAVQDRFVWARPRYITTEKFEQLQRYQVRPGDVLVTIMGTCGRCAVVPDDIPVAINTKHLCCISLDTNKCLPEFLWACLKYDQAVRRQLGATARGAVMPGLNMGLIKSAEVPLPPMEVQHDFIRRLNKVREVDERLAQSAREFGALFSSLQQRAFAGQL